ncbi:MAG: hypothetical protein GHCLOJNM_02155 [bacterium]|nr:hypothetical protein [bacterium]
MLKITGLVWLEQVVEKLRVKHHVTPHEVEEALANSPLFRFLEKGLRPGENVYAALGGTDAGRPPFVVFIYTKKKKALILSARNMTRAERRLHENA